MLGHTLQVGDRVSASYEDGREFSGVITLIENQKGEWSDGNPHELAERVMVRIRTERGTTQSFWMDKVVGISKLKSSPEKPPPPGNTTTGGTKP